MDLTIVIPTYRRGEVLLETLAALHAQRRPGTALLVVDQTADHPPAVAAELARLGRGGVMRRITMLRPSIPAAMNEGLRQAASELVLFLDDDIVPGDALAAAHLQAHRTHAPCLAVAGQVLQPGEDPADVAYEGPDDGLAAYLRFPFHSTRGAWVKNVMAGNLSVSRGHALSIGGFDERFEGAAFRFETDFARRLVASGGAIRYEPRASVRHLQSETGGTRAAGGHLRSGSPAHGIGDYYYALRHGHGRDCAAYVLGRPFRQVRTRFHLRHPWWIPVKFIGELRAMAGAFALARKGPKYGT